MDRRSWPALHPELWPLAKLVPYARNSRTHSPAQVRQIAASVREWGWTMPVLVDEAGMIIAGHGRVMAAELLEIAEVPVIVARGWSEAQKRAYVIADNKLPENAGWDEALLAAELHGLDGEGFDLGLIGFRPDELADLLAPIGGDLLPPGDADADDGEAAVFGVVIEATDEAAQQALLDRFLAEGLKVRAIL